MRAPVRSRDLFQPRACQTKRGPDIMSTSTTTKPVTPDPRDGAAVGRLAYPELETPKRFGERRNEPGSGSGDPRYGCSLIAYAKPAELMKSNVTSAIKAVVNATYKNAEDLPSRGLRGVKKEPLIKPVNEYPKMWPDAPEDAIFIRMSSFEQPFFYDSEGQRLSPEHAKLVLVAGAWVRCLFRAFHYEKGGDPGIGLGLNAVQYLRPAPRFGRAAVATDALHESTDELFADLDI
jgi:Protein of unknown function (DUF2815)